MNIEVNKGLFKCIDLYNNNVWYSKNTGEMKKQAQEYFDKCEGICMLSYRVYDYINDNYRIMSSNEVKQAGFPL